MPSLPEAPGRPSLWQRWGASKSGDQQGTRLEKRNGQKRGKKKGGRKQLTTLNPARKAGRKGKCNEPPRLESRRSSVGNEFRRERGALGEENRRAKFGACQASVDATNR